MSVNKLEAVSWQGLLLADGRYQIGPTLGAGGMAQVYRAHDLRLGCDVVVKVPHPALLLQPGFAARFSLEVRSLVRLTHPHVVRALDVGEHNGIPFAVLQYLSGGSLRSRFPSTAPLASLSGWLEAVAGALDFIHSKGYLHRDIKADNILFDEHGHAFLSDFGIAKALGDEGGEHRQQTLTGTGMVLGTPQYMAPELLLGRPYDGHVDQYALAVTVYELLGGRLPHEGPTPAAIFLAQTSKPAPPLSAHCPSLPAAVTAAVQRGLARDPAQRFPGCAAFARAVLSSGGSTPPPADPGEATACPKCGAVFHLPERARGKQVRCRACQGVFRAPERKPAAAPAETVPRLQAGANTVPVAAGRRMSASRRRRGIWLVLAATLLIGAALGGLGGWMILRPHRPAQSTQPGSAREGGSKPAFPEPSRSSLVGHTDGVKSVAISPDGTHLASAGADETVRVWNTATGKDLLTFKEHSGCVRCVSFSPDGTRLASGGNDQTIRIWDAATGQEVRKLEGHTNWVRSICWSPDGARLASGGDDDSVRLWDAQTGQEIRSFSGHNSWVWTVCFRPDGKQLASASDDQTVRIWDALSGEHVRTLRGHTNRVTSVAWSPDGKQLASSSVDETVRIWDASTGEELHTLRGHTNDVTSVCWSPDGKRLASGSEDQSVRIWNASAGEEVRTLEGHTGTVTCVCCRADGRYCISGSDDKTVRLWKLSE